MTLSGGMWRLRIYVGLILSDNLAAVLSAAEV